MRNRDPLISAATGLLGGLIGSIFRNFKNTIITILVVNIVLGGLATQYVIQFWATLIKGVPVDAPFTICAIAGLFLGEFTIPAAVITWLFHFVL